MSSSSSGWCGESGAGGRSSDTRKKISSSSQKPGAGYRRRAAARSRRRHQADLFFALARARPLPPISPAFRLPAGSSHSSRSTLGAVLPDQDHAAVVGHRHQDDRRRGAGRSRLRARGRSATARCPTSTENTRPSKTTCIDDRSARICISFRLRAVVESLAQLVEHALQIVGQRARRTPSAGRRPDA